MKLNKLYLNIFLLFILLSTNISNIYCLSSNNTTQKVKEYNTEWVKNQNEQSFTGCDEDFRLAGLELRSSWKTAKNIYGKPLSKSVTKTSSEFDPSSYWYYTNWIYPELKICFVNTVPKNSSPPKEPGMIYSITLTNNKYKTFRGIKVGDSVNKIKENYGAVKWSIFEQSPDKMIYPTKNSYLEFKLHNNKVISIMVSMLIID